MLNGIDVSNWQGTVIWRDVKAAGYDFAGLKATEGLLYHDPTFNRNWDRCEWRGIKRIAYHFFHPNESGKGQADYFHSTVHNAGGFLAGDCAMLDLEITSGMDTAHIVEEAEAFATHFLATTQCGLYVYTAKWFWDGIMGAPHSEVLGKCALWDASYGSNPIAPANWPNGASIWQWTSTLTVPGIKGNVDGNRFLGTMEQYNILARKSGRE